MPLLTVSSLFYPSSDPLVFTNSVRLPACLSVFLPGVARVSLTRPDRDNSLTHSVVCFSPLLFPPLHSIPLLSLYSSPTHPAVQPPSSAGFDRSGPPASQPVSFSVISLSCRPRPHARPPPSIRPSICLSVNLSAGLPFS